MNYNWNWNIFWAQAPDGTGVYFWWLISGLGWTLSTALLAWAIALTLGATVGTLRTTPMKWVVRLGNAYVANRAWGAVYTQGSVAKMAGDRRFCVDRNGSTVIETSTSSYEWLMS